MTHIRAVRLFPALFIGCLVVAPAAFAQEVLPSQTVPADPPPQDAPVQGDISGPGNDGLGPTVTDAEGLVLNVQNVNPPPADQIPDIDPIRLYGNEIVFDVYRKNSKVGEHRATFSRQGDDLMVTSQMNIAVDVLFFTAYRFEYESTEVWRNGELRAISVNVDDNGKIARTTAKVEDGLFKIDGPRGSFIGSSWVFPTNHWHRGQASSTTILNTLNGRLSQVEVVPRGIEQIVTAQGTVEADHFEYTGQLRDTEVWYDAQNRWVKMRFKARDGSAIEYRCRQCGLAMPAQEASGTN